jgi:hypothetical protein
MTPSGARVVDPVLTSVAQGYSNNEFVGSALFPVVPVTLRAGRVIAFGKEDFQLYQTRRAPGENTRRVQFGYSSDPYALADFSLEGQVPVEVVEEGRNGPGIDHASVAVRKVSDIMALQLEYAQSSLARNAQSYASSNKATLTGSDQWSDYGAASNPIEVIEDAKESVRKATGKRVNIMVMGAAVMAKLRQHPVVIERLKYTGRDVATTEILSALFGVPNVLVGDAIYAGDNGQFADVWGRDVVLAHTETASMAEMGTPSYGYTYTLSGYPIVEEGYYDRSSKSWVYPVTRAEAPVMAGPLAGFLIKNAVA